MLFFNRERYSETFLNFGSKTDGRRDTVRTVSAFARSKPGTPPSVVIIDHIKIGISRASERSRPTRWLKSDYVSAAVNVLPDFVVSPVTNGR